MKSAAVMDQVDDRIGYEEIRLRSRSVHRQIAKSSRGRSFIARFPVPTVTPETADATRHKAIIVFSGLHRDF